MKKIDSYILKSFTGPFFVTFFVVLFVLVMQFLWLYVDDIVGKGLGIFPVLKLLFYMATTMVPMALPLAILLSSIMTFGNMSEHYELAAMKSAGISLRRAMMPLIGLMVLLSIGAFFFANNVIPYSNFKARNLLWNITRQKPALNIRPGVFDTSIDGFAIKVGKKYGEEDEKIEDVIIYDMRDNRGNVKVTVAERGTMKPTENQNYLEITLFEGYNYEESKEAKKRSEKIKQPFQKMRFSKQVIHMDLTSFKVSDLNDEKHKDNYSMLNIAQLHAALDTLNEEQNQRIESFSKRLVGKTGMAGLDEDSLLLAKSDERSLAMVKRDSLENLIATDTSYVSTPADSTFLADVHYTDEKVNDIMEYATGAYIGQEILRNAIDRARSAKEYIHTTEKSMTWKQQQINRHGLEVHRKYALSFSCLVLFFIGAPLGAIIRKGGMGLPVVMAIMIFLVYHIIFMTCERMGIAGTLDVISARWMASWILLPFGIWLTYKATTDSALLNTEVYFRPVYKLLGMIKERKEQKKKEKKNQEEHNKV